MVGDGSELCSFNYYINVVTGCTPDKYLFACITGHFDLFVITEPYYKDDADPTITYQVKDALHSRYEYNLYPTQNTFVYLNPAIPSAGASSPPNPSKMDGPNYWSSALNTTAILAMSSSSPPNIPNGFTTILSTMVPSLFILPMPI